MVVVHQVGGAIGLGHLEAALPGADGKDLPCPAEDRRPHCHKAHRADAQDCHRGPKGRVQLAHPLKGGAHHVRHHHCLLQGDPLGDVGQVHVRVPNIVLLHEGAAPLGIIHPGVEVVLALLAPAVLGLQAPPMGHDGADNHPVPHVEVLDLGPHFGDLAAHLVAHGLPHQIGQGGAPRSAQVGIAGAGGPDQRTDQGPGGAGFLRHGAAVRHRHGILPRDHNAFAILHPWTTPFCSRGGAAFTGHSAAPGCL